MANPTVTSPDRAWWPLVTVACVPVLVVVTLLGTDIGRNTVWKDTPFNPSEAILMGDFAQAVRRMEAGADVGKRYPIQLPEWDGPKEPMSPLEAAVRVGEAVMIRTLLRLGASPDDAERVRLTCLALTLKDEESARALNSGALPPGICH